MYLRTLLLSLTLLVPSLAAAVPMQLQHQGRLSDAVGAPLTGTHDLGLAIYDAATGGTALWSETQTQEIDNGFFAVVLGNDAVGNPLGDDIFANDRLFLEITVDAEVLPARVPLLSVPFARRAGGVSGPVVATEITVNGTTIIESDGTISFSTIDDLPPGLEDGDTLDVLSCDTGQIVRFDGADWACADAADHEHYAEDITAGIMDIQRLPVGTSDDTVAAGDHGHSLSTLEGTLRIDQLPSDISSAVIPAGMIAMFGGACPSGWSAYAPLASRFPRGAADPSSLGTGGSDDAVAVAHAHSFTGSSGNAGNHAHNTTGNTASDGAHTHQMWSRNDDFNCSGDSGQGWGIQRCPDHGSVNWSTSGFYANTPGSNHAHAINLNSNTTGEHSHSVSGTVASAGGSGTGANMPAYQEVAFCIKD